MFLTLNHQKLDIYQAPKSFVFECYRMTKILPSEERYGMISQIRRAALSVHLNIAEDASRKSETERKRYYEVARGSIIEIDAALDIASMLKYIHTENLKELGELLSRCVRMLCGMIEAKH
jgi:four helix bundle protein